MYLKIGNYTICDSATDDITKMLLSPTSALKKSSDSVQPLGSTNPTHFQRKGVSRAVEITVVRQFSSYREAEVWTVEHLAELEKFSAGGDLEFESMLGVGYLYGSASLEDIEVVQTTGVSVEIKYSFKAGRAITFYGLSFTEEATGIEYLLTFDDGVCPLIRTAKG